MALRSSLDPTADAAEGDATGSDDELAVEPVEALAEASRTAPHPAAPHAGGLQRLALQLRVAQLQGELDRARRRREEVVQRYEEILAERNGATSPTFSWR